MFKQREKNSTHFAADSISIISVGLKMSGDIEAEYDMRIDGTIVGNVFCKAKVVLGASGKIEGDLHANNADIFGTVNGNIATKELLCLKSKCFINGNIQVGRLDIELEAEFNGQCTMTHQPNSIDKPKEKLLLLQEN